MALQVLGDIQFKFYHQWFDFIFIISALFFLAVFYTIDSARHPSATKVGHPSATKVAATTVTACWWRQVHSYQDNCSRIKS